MKLSIEQHFMSPAELINSIPKKAIVAPPQIINTVSPGNEFPLARILMVAGVSIGLVYVGYKIYDNYQKKKLEENRMF
jgi:uncharacterized membrane protein YebE (DUF533 family)